MKYLLLITAFVLSGCAGPKYIAADISSSLVDLEPSIMVINHQKTRSSFQKAMTTWLENNDKPFEILPASSTHSPDFLTLEYVGRWSWDLGLFLADAEIKAYHGGKQVGTVQFIAPNTFNSAKYGDAEERIGYMMDVLFGYESAESATTNVN
jgi:hypothetical protein